VQLHLLFFLSETLSSREMIEAATPCTRLLPSCGV